MNYGHGYRNMQRRQKRSKYNNNRGGGFDSGKEALRYQELLLLQKAGKIANLERQVEYPLTPTVREPDKVGPRGGRKPGKVILKASSYIADFTYTDLETGEFIVEDVKGYKGGEAYKLVTLKKKFVYRIYGILIREV